MTLNENARRAVKISAFVLIPAAVLFGSLFASEHSYAFITLAVALLTLAAFAAAFERKKVRTRRLIIASVMIALSVAGRFIPFFKPVTALTIISAVYLGSETGFLVGAMSAAVSNIYFGQGPWTPFQMLAWGLIGLIAGALSSPLKRSRIALALYGALSGVMFSLMMDVWTVLWYSGGFDLKLYTAAILTALPYTAIYAVSNVIFLWLCAKPFGEKLERVKLKYNV